MQALSCELLKKKVYHQEKYRYNRRNAVSLRQKYNGPGDICVRNIAYPVIYQMI